MKCVYNQYEVEEIRRYIEQENKKYEKNAQGGLEVAIDNDEKSVLFYLRTRMDKDLWCRYTILKVEEAQTSFHSTLLLLGENIHEVILCFAVDLTISSPYIFIRKWSIEKEIPVILDTAKKNREKGKISNEEYQQAITEIRKMRLKSVFSLYNIRKKSEKG